MNMSELQVASDLYWLMALTGFGFVVGLAGLCAGAWAMVRYRAIQDELHRVVTAVQQQLNVVTSGAVGVGEKLSGVEQHLRRTMEKQQELEHRDPGQLPYSQAVRLIAMGATAEDLVHSCGLSRAEADLVFLLHGQIRKGGARAANQ